MEIDELKERVGEICQLLGGGLPYEGSQVDGDDWDSVATCLADVARHIQVCGSRVAGYAGVARRKANQLTDSS